MKKTRYWIGVASKEHVLAGTKGGFAQFCHGKPGPARKLSNGDWVILYSSKERVGESKICQQFTAIGRVIDSEATQVEQSPGFHPYRRKIAYRKSTAVDIRPLIGELSFIKNKSSWGAAFRFGFLEIPERDFERIAAKMLPRGRSPAGDRLP